MSSENTLTGRGGHVTVDLTEIARVTQWEVNPTLATSNEWGDSDGNDTEGIGLGLAGYTNRSAGRRDCTFTTEGKFDILDIVYSLFQPNDIAAVALHQDAANTYSWTFARALCTDFSLSVNVDTEEVIGWNASWGTDGAFTGPNA